MKCVLLSMMSGQFIPGHVSCSWKPVSKWLYEMSHLNNSHVLNGQHKVLSENIHISLNWVQAFSVLLALSSLGGQIFVGG